MNYRLVSKVKRCLVIIDDGHGMNTSGKQTPKFADGTFMKENDFNDAVAKKMGAKFTQVAVDVYYTATEVGDVPLPTRTARANAKYKEYISKYGAENVICILISVHANAYLGYWGTWGGINTFYQTGSSRGLKLATAVHTELKKGTQLRDRGVKSNNLHMTRETLMGAILVECGFMDNLEEAKLLRSDAYRDECADEIFRGACNYMGVKFEVVPEVVAPKPVVTVGTFLVGDKVSIKSTAKTYATGQNMSSFVYGKAHTIEKIETGKALLKEIMSWVRMEDLQKFTAVAPSAPTTPVASAPKVDYRKTTENLNLRAGATTSHKVILTIPKGSILKVEQLVSGWAKVTYEGSVGYVSTSYLQTQSPSNIKMATANLNMRTGAGTGYKIIRTIPKNTYLYVEGASGSWRKIIHEGKTGYVHSDYLK